MTWEETQIDDDAVRLGMSDIKNRWLHSKGEKGMFERDCIDEIISLNRFAQAHATWHSRDSEIEQAGKDGRKDVVKFIEDNWMIKHSPNPDWLRNGLIMASPEQWQTFKKSNGL